ncbi:ABC transporter substrate-binding protein [Nocardioides sp. SLBN-35]|uniref:ABC transporter substrate-binding protein n=1 Tax=Nocardioides sp. SLBN-35 TaxID=2768445 RepID=UPI001152D66E|nr:ABC transporter substrate-binding protein [Nocardioides sp. SLBN-35]TQK68453.1 amino acid/amide ABC transporter substrate-binding protein (HAAT family) [Nocardioides sp. SLBN-35]
MLGFARPFSGRIALSALSVGTLVLTAACSGGSDAADGGDQLVVGFALSQSGNMAPFDVEPGNAALLRIKEINADGGIDGKKIKVVSKDVRSDPDTVGTAATELIAEGIDLLVTPCDFDLSAPGASVAQASEIPSVSICAGDPKMADTTTLGDYVFSANAGSDVEGASGAAWAYEKGWRSAYVLQDESIEYTKSAGRYFTAKFEELGGKIVGDDAFPGGDNVNISSQASRLKGLAQQPDFVYVASWNPGGATAIRQLREAGVTIPVVGPAALDGQVLLDVVGDKASDIYYTGFACYVYCTGADSADLDTFVKDYQAEYKSEPASSYALLGYNMVSAIADAAGRAKSFSGADLKAALEGDGSVTTPIGDVAYFSKTCHKIIDMPMTVVQVADGAMTFAGQQRVDSIPNVDDGNSCAS